MAPHTCGTQRRLATNGISSHPLPARRHNRKKMNAAQKKRDKAARAVMHAALSQRQRQHALANAVKEALLHSTAAPSDPGTINGRSVSIVPDIDLPLVVIPADQPSMGDRCPAERESAPVDDTLTTSETSGASVHRWHEWIDV